MRKSKAPYIYVLLAVLVISLLIVIIPFTEKRESPDQRTGEAGGEDIGIDSLDLSANHIIQRAIHAHGGLKSISSLKTLKMKTSSSLITTEEEIAVENASYSFPDRMRSDAQIGSETYTQAYSKGSAWVVENGVARDGDLRTNEILRKSMKHFPTYLLQAADSASLAMIKGKSFIEGKPHYLIHVIDSDTDEFILWIALEDYLVKRIDYPIYAGATEEHMRLDFFNFRPTEEITLPYRVNIFLNGILVQETTVLSYELNATLPDSLFEKPESEKPR